MHLIQRLKTNSCSISTQTYLVLNIDATFLFQKILKVMSLTERPIGEAQSSDGPVGIFWDIENCPIPDNISPDDISVNIRRTIHSMNSGTITSFSAYGDFKGFPLHLCEACERAGIKLIDIPNTRKHTTKIAIHADLFLFALDHSPPSSILLISTDMDFAHPLHVLGQCGFTIILASPVTSSISLALSNSRHFLWDWTTITCSSSTAKSSTIDSIPEAKKIIPSVQSGDLEQLRMQVVGLLKRADGRLPFASLANKFRKMYGQNLSLAQYGIKKMKNLPNIMGDMVMIVGKGPNKMMVLRQEGERNSSAHGALANLSTLAAESEKQSVRSEDLEGLKKQLVKLLERAEGKLPLAKLRQEYSKFYGGELPLKEYGIRKLKNLVNIIGDVVTVIGVGANTVVVLRKEKADMISSTSGSVVDIPIPTQKNQICFELSGDSEGLKQQLVRLLKETEGSLPLNKLMEAYMEMYGQEFSIMDCGTTKLKRLLNTMEDVVTIIGTETNEVVALRQEEKERSPTSHGASASTSAGFSSLAAEDVIQFIPTQDLEGLKKQMVRLMKGVGGRLPLVKLPLEYAKIYGLLDLAEYGTQKLVKMLDMIGDVVNVIGEGESMEVILRREKDERSFAYGGDAVDFFANLTKDEILFIQPGNLEEFKKQVVNLLKEAGGRLPVVNLPVEYEKMFGIQLSVAAYGTEKLVKLLGMIGDVVTIVKEGNGTIVILQGEEVELISSRKRMRLH